MLCENKEHFINDIINLEEDIQAELMSIMQPIIQQYDPSNDIMHSASGNNDHNGNSGEAS